MYEFSVLMSVYDKEKPNNLKESIESIINQSVMPNEVIIVADGELTPELNAILIHYQNTYEKLIKVIYLHKNVGLGQALDIGLMNCKYEYVARMDSDDYSKFDRFKRQFNYLKDNPQVDILGTSISEFNEKNIITGSRKVPLNDLDIKKYIKKRSPFNHPTVVFKKSKVILFGGYGKLARKQDIDLFSRMLFNDCIGANIDEDLIMFRSDNNNFKRRKSMGYVMSYIRVMKNNLNRRYIGLKDFIIVTIIQLIILLMPMRLFKIINKKILRKSYKL